MEDVDVPCGVLHDERLPGAEVLERGGVEVGRRDHPVGAHDEQHVVLTRLDERTGRGRRGGLEGVAVGGGRDGDPPVLEHDGVAGWEHDPVVLAVLGQPIGPTTRDTGEGAGGEHLVIVDVLQAVVGPLLGGVVQDGDEGVRRTP